MSLVTLPTTWHVPLVERRCYMITTTPCHPAIAAIVLRRNTIFCRTQNPNEFLPYLLVKSSQFFAMNRVGATPALREPVRGAFVFLVGPDRAAAGELRQSLEQLHENVLQSFPRPVLLFYGDDVDEQERRETGGPPDP